MLTVEGPWSPDRRRKLSPRDEKEEEGEPLSLSTSMSDSALMKVFADIS